MSTAAKKKAKKTGTGSPAIDRGSSSRAWGCCGGGGYATVLSEGGERELPSAATRGPRRLPTCSSYFKAAEHFPS
eukprot:6169280-Amphidinium_carterae.1